MDMSNQPTPDDFCFSDSEREALYKTVFTRRDVRGQFTSKPVPEDVLSRVLMAAHYAPSVGFMQPWNFVIVRKDETKRKVHGLFETAHKEAANMFEGEQRETYQSLKLEGILESPNQYLHHLRQGSRRSSRYWPNPCTGYGRLQQCLCCSKFVASLAR